MQTLHVLPAPELNGWVFFVCLVLNAMEDLGLTELLPQLHFLALFSLVPLHL